MEESLLMSEIDVIMDDNNMTLDEAMLYKLIEEVKTLKTEIRDLGFMLQKEIEDVRDSVEGIRESIDLNE